MQPHLSKFWIHGCYVIYGEMLISVAFFILPLSIISLLKTTDATVLMIFLENYFALHSFHFKEILKQNYFEFIFLWGF